MKNSKIAVYTKLSKSKLIALAASSALFLAVPAGLEAADLSGWEDSDFETAPCLQITGSSFGQYWQIDKGDPMASFYCLCSQSCSGSKMAFINASQKWNGLHQTLTIPALSRCHLEAMVKTSANVVSGFLGAKDSNGNVIKQSFFGGSAFSECKKVTVDFTTGLDQAITVFVGFNGPGASGQIWFADVHLWLMGPNDQLVDHAGFDNQIPGYQILAPWSVSGPPGNGYGVQAGCTGGNMAWLSVNPNVSGWNEITQPIATDNNAVYQASAVISADVPTVFGVRDSRGQGLGSINNPPMSCGTVSFLFKGKKGDVIDIAPMMTLFVGYNALANGFHQMDVGQVEVRQVFPSPHISRSGSSIQISWPSIFTCQLQEATSLMPPNWTAVPVTPRLVGNQWVVTLPIGTQNTYFRLACQ